MVLLYFESISKSGKMKNMPDQVGNRIYELCNMLVQYCFHNLHNYMVTSVNFVIYRKNYIVYLPIGNNDLQALLEDI